MDDRRTRLFVTLAIVLMVSLTLVDVITDLHDGEPADHYAVDGGQVLLSIAAIFTLWRRGEGLARTAREARADATRWRQEAEAHLRGLGAAIDRQFEGWKLTPAEKEVGLMLLKGLALKEVADARGTSERTVRQQAQEVYKKAGVAGRAELTAFFLEDLLLPR